MVSNSTHQERPPVPNLSIPRGVTPFFFSTARGRLIRLGALADCLLTRHAYPPCISALGGKVLTLVAGLASSLKFEGSFSLQIKGEGPVSLIVADCTDTGALRFYIRFDENIVQTLPENVSDKSLLGKGLFALTIDQKNNPERYQGMVELQGETLAEMAMYYFNVSEQLPCLIQLTCQYTATGWQAAGMILEKIANQPAEQIDREVQQEQWNTLTILASTLKTEELLDESLSEHRLLYRLFNNENLSITKPRPLSYGCRCSRSRLADLLKTFSKDDIEDMLQKEKIIMTCEFCKYDFVFSRNEIT